MVEYVLLVASILIVCIYFYTTGNSPMSQGVNASLNSIVNEINNLNSQIQFPST